MKWYQCRQHFLAPAPAWRCGLLRWISAGWLLTHFLPRYQERLHDWTSLPAAWHQLGGPLAALVPPATVIQGWEAPWSASLWVVGTLAVLGVAAPLSCGLFALGMGLMAAWEMGFGFFDHEVVLMVETLAVCAFAPGADALSLGALRAWALRRAGGGSPPPPAEVSGWGPRLVLALLASVYLAAGIAKLRFSGGQWLDGQTLGFYFSGRAADYTQQLFVAVPSRATDLWRDGVGLTDHLYRAVPSALSLRLSQWPAGLVAMAVSGTLLELAAPVALLSPRIRTAWLAAMISFHALNGHLMGLPFYGYQLLCLGLIPWPLRRPAPPPAGAG